MLSCCLAVFRLNYLFLYIIKTLTTPFTLCPLPPCLSIATSFHVLVFASPLYKIVFLLVFFVGLVLCVCLCLCDCIMHCRYS
jgi:hypothetical protein